MVIDSDLVKIIGILVGSGALGSLLALIPALFNRRGQSAKYGTAAGVGFLMGASIGGLFGMFAVLLGRI